MGLNDSFSHIRGQILLMDPLPSVNKVLSLVIQEEKLKEISVKSLTHDTAALMTKSAATPNRFVKQSNRKDTPVCTHFGVSGQTAEKCYNMDSHQDSNLLLSASASR